MNVAVAAGRMVADMKGKGIKEITGMRLNGARSIRAKFPNGNMELSGNWLSGPSSRPTPRC